MSPVDKVPERDREGERERERERGGGVKGGGGVRGNGEREGERKIMVCKTECHISSKLFNLLFF